MSLPLSPSSTTVPPSSSSSTSLPVPIHTHGGGGGSSVSMVGTPDQDKLDYASSLTSLPSDLTQELVGVQHLSSQYTPELFPNLQPRPSAPVYEDFGNGGGSGGIPGGDQPVNLPPDHYIRGYPTPSTASSGGEGVVAMTTLPSPLQPVAIPPPHGHQHHHHHGNSSNMEGTSPLLHQIVPPRRVPPGGHPSHHHHSGGIALSEPSAKPVLHFHPHNGSVPQTFFGTNRLFDSEHQQQHSSRPQQHYLFAASGTRTGHGHAQQQQQVPIPFRNHSSNRGVGLENNSNSSNNNATRQQQEEQHSLSARTSNLWKHQHGSAERNSVGGGGSGVGGKHRSSNRLHSHATQYHRQAKEDPPIVGVAIQQ